MAEVSTIGLDIAKQVFQAHGADASGHVVFRKKLARGKLIEFFASQPRCVVRPKAGQTEVVLEACGGAHHWGREISRLGHTVRLIPPAYVKPFVKRQKNDAADAEAICEAAQRSMAESPESGKIVAAVIGLGHSLGLPTVAEGVEDVATAGLLAEMGCDIGQGWLFGRPVAEADAGRMAETTRPAAVLGEA